MTRMIAFMTKLGLTCLTCRGMQQEIWFACAMHLGGVRRAFAQAFHCHERVAQGVFHVRARGTSAATCGTAAELVGGSGAPSGAVRKTRPKPKSSPPNIPAAMIEALPGPIGRLSPSESPTRLIRLQVCAAA